MFSKADKRKALARIRAIRDGGGRNAVAQLAACRLILDDGHAPTLANATDAELLAEVYRRGLQAPTVDLDAAERAMEAKHGEG